MDRCLNCMQETASDVCPYCGYDRSAYELQPGALKPQTRLKGRYYTGCVLGRGGFGITYNGWDAQAGRRVAIKEYFPSGLVARIENSNTVSALSSANTHAYKSGVVKFFDEAQILTEFRGVKEIVEIYDFFYENETSYIVMEYVEGQNILQFMANRNRMDTGTAFVIILKLIDTMMKVHARDVLHRDISPSNIIVTGDGGIKLIDFGSARQFELDQQNSMSIILKNGFAPIEQYSRKGNHGPWTDNYSICATFYYMITGKLPEQATDRLIEDTLISPSKLDADITPKQEAVLLKGLAVKAADRYQSASELKAAFAEAYGKDRVTAFQVLKEEQMTVSLEDAPARKGRYNRFIPVLITLIGMAVITVTVLSLTIWRRPTEPIRTDAVLTAEDKTETNNIASFTKNTETETAVSAETGLEMSETTESTETEPESAEKAETKTEDIAARSITLSRTTLTLEKGGTGTLAATVDPENVPDKAVTWSTDNSTVASVSGGRITARDAGTAVITAKTSNGKTAACTVTVKTIAVEKVAIKQSSVILNSGETAALEVTVSPGNAEDKTVTLTSSDPNVAAVNRFTVTAKNAGNATITAKSPNGITDTCMITVKAIEVVSVELDKTTLNIIKKDIDMSVQIYTLNAAISPANATDRSVTWTSSNSNVVTAWSDGDGKCTGQIKHTGTAVVTAKTSNGKTAACTIIVEKEKTVEVEKVNIEQTSVTLNSGETTTLSVTILPIDAADKKVTVTSSDPNVAAVNGFTVTAKNPGTATITARSSNGKTALCTVTVNSIEATGISLNQTSLTLTPGETASLTVTIVPSNTTDKRITWSSDNIVAATVNDKGYITARAEGTATITAKTSNGISAACTVIVKRKITANGSCGVNATWTLYNDGELVIDGEGKMHDYAYYDSIYAPWYKYTTKINTIKMNKGILNIGDCAFRDCINLTSITIPNSITGIGFQAFGLCYSLIDITIPNSVTYIEDQSFVLCSNLTSITIPDSVTDLGRSIFENCRKLASINVDSNNMYFFNDEYGVLYNKNKTILIRYPAGKTSVAFSIPNCVTDISTDAFGDCNNLINLTMPNSILNIHYCALGNCTKLTNITIPDSVVYIGSFAFCGWTDKHTIYIEGRSSAPSGWDSGWYNDCNAVIKWDQ